MSIDSEDGYAFLLDAMLLRIVGEFKRVGITTRIKAIQKWGDWNEKKRAQFLGKIILGSCKFPDDPKVMSPYQVAAADTVTGPGE